MSEAADYSALYITTPVSKHKATNPVRQLPTPPQNRGLQYLSTYTFSTKGIALASMEV
jgi:hypothetical protein